MSFWCFRILCLKIKKAKRLNAKKCKLLFFHQNQIITFFFAVPKGKAKTNKKKKLVQNQIKLTPKTQNIKPQCHKVIMGLFQ
jgi:TnpA family transposase